MQPANLITDAEFGRDRFGVEFRFGWQNALRIIQEGTFDFCVAIISNLDIFNYTSNECQFKSEVLLKQPGGSSFENQGITYGR